MGDNEMLGPRKNVRQQRNNVMKMSRLLNITR